MKECYAFEEGQLIIQDPDLGISLHSLYAPRRIPKDFAQLPDMIVTKDEQGTVCSAFFQVDDSLDGQCLHYFSDGTVQSECYYKQGKLHGPSRFFSESGVRLSESWYFDGKREGRVLRRFLSGEVASVQCYKEDRLHGMQTFYYDIGVARAILGETSESENQNLKTIMHYQEGVLEGKVILYWPNGVKKREVFFKKGMRDGFDRMWNVEGILTSEESYNNGYTVAETHFG